MGKKNSSPINSLKSALNKASETVVNTYDIVSADVVTTMEKIIPIETKKINVEINNELKQENEQNKISVQEILPEKKQNEFNFIGCYSDDPSNPSMENYLGEISNSLECIELGRKNNFKYVGVQQGDKCYGSNKIPSTQLVDSKENCNIGCDDINSGNCGGFFYNSVYNTDIKKNEINRQENILSNDMKNFIKLNIEDKSNQEKLFNITNTIKTNAISEFSNSNEIFENFKNSDIDIEKINYGLGYINLNCHEPMNIYILITWFIILIILFYLLFEYIRIKNSKKKI